MDLFIKCLSAVIIMTVIHFISKTKSYYLSALVLGFPCLSMLAYYFMYIDLGGEKVRNTTLFALICILPFGAFLLVLNLLLKKSGIGFSLAVSAAAWMLLALIVIALWVKLNRM